MNVPDETGDGKAKCQDGAGQRGQAEGPFPKAVDLDLATCCDLISEVNQIGREPSEKGWIKAVAS